MLTWLGYNYKNVAAVCYADSIFIPDIFLLLISERRFFHARCKTRAILKQRDLRNLGRKDMGLVDAIAHYRLVAGGMESVRWHGLSKRLQKVGGDSMDIQLRPALRRFGIPVQPCKILHTVSRGLSANAVTRRKTTSGSHLCMESSTARLISSSKTIR